MCKHVLGYITSSMLKVVQRRHQHAVDGELLEQNVAVEVDEEVVASVGERVAAHHHIVAEVQLGVMSPLGRF